MSIQCVKALVYINQDDLLDINACNDAGDTALHLATKWAYGLSLMFTDQQLNQNLHTTTPHHTIPHPTTKWAYGL